MKVWIAIGATCDIFVPMGPFVFHSEKQIFVLRSQNWTWTPRLIPNGPEGLLELESGAKIGYFPKCIPNTEAIFRSLEQEVEWQRRSIILYGRGVMQPRLIAYMADHPSLSFTYSRSTLFPSEYTPTVAAIKTQLEAFLQSTFNCVLLNFYRDGKDNVGWHSDDEHLFGPDPFIASVSFGERRAFDLRSNHDSKIRIRYDRSMNET